MLNIQVFSDLHMDINDGCQKDIVISPDADVIVFAGDLFNNAKKTVDYLYAKVMQLPDHQHIVYVFGNHEFYNCDIQTAINYALSKMHHRLHLLRTGTILTIENVVFFGDTFWTDFESEGSRMLAMHYAKHNMSDFSCIFEDKKIPRFIKPERTVELHNQALEWFKAQRFRVRVEDNSLSAEKGFLRETGNLLFHLSLILILVGVSFGSLFGMRGEAIVSTGERFINVATSYDTLSFGKLTGENSLSPFEIKLDKFVGEYDPKTNAPKDYTAWVTIKDGDKTMKKVMKVNKPLTFGNTRV